VNCHNLTYEWTTVLNGATDCGSISNSIITDEFGNSYIIGEFIGFVDFDPGPATYYLSSIFSSWDVFIQKLDSNGNFVWAKSFGSYDWDSGSSLTIDIDGNIYATGYFFGFVDFDPSFNEYFINSAGLNDIYILKLNSSGDFIWAKSIGGECSDAGQSIYADNNGYIYLTGSFCDSVDFNPGLDEYFLTGIPSNSTIYVLKLDINGDFIWAKSLGVGILTCSGSGTSIITDTFGNIYTTGNYAGSGNFNPNGEYNLNWVGNTDIFVSKLDSNGNFIWAKSIGGINGDVAKKINTDNSSNVYIAGYFYQDSPDFDPDLGTHYLISHGQHEGFILKLNIDGNLDWVYSFGDTLSDDICSVNFDSFNNIYVLGNFSGYVDFNPSSGINSITSSGESDLFLLKLDSNGQFCWVESVPSSDVGNIYGLNFSIDTNENIYIVGWFNGAIDFDFTEDNMDYYWSTDDQDGWGGAFLSKWNQNIENNVSVNTFNDDSLLRIYPNPSNDFIFIEYNLHPFILSIYDSFGKIIYNQNIDSEKFSLNTKFLSKGVYSFVIRSKKDNLSKKVIIH